MSRGAWCRAGSAVVLAVAAACARSPSTGEPPAPAVVPGEVARAVRGRVTDQHGRPVAGAPVLVLAGENPFGDGPAVRAGALVDRLGAAAAAEGLTVLGSRS